MSALRISHTVYGRQLVGNKVYYFIDPERQEGPKGIPETVALARWRKRKRAGYVFSGTRLGPNIWRGVVLVFGTDASEICSFDAETIELARKHLQPVLKAQHYGLPSAVSLHALFSALGPSRLQKVIDRQRRPDRAERHGTPDLFLFSRASATGRYADVHFVEVKKPGERVSDDQKEEIAFLLALGLKARVLRLIER